MAWIVIAAVFVVGIGALAAWDCAGVGRGVPPYAEAALVQCSAHAGTTRGVDRCMISTFERAVADAGGKVSAEFTVQRVVTIGEQEIDCAAPPPEGHQTSCMVAVSMLSPIEVLHRSPGQMAHPVMQCPASSSGLDGCVAVGGLFELVAMGARGSVRPAAIVGGTDCASEGACVLRLVDADGSVATELSIVVERQVP